MLAVWLQINLVFYVLQNKTLQQSLNLFSQATNKFFTETDVVTLQIQSCHLFIY